MRFWRVDRCCKYVVNVNDYFRVVHAFDVVSVLSLGLMLLLIRFLYEKVRIVKRAKLEDTSHIDVYTSSRPTVQNVRRGGYFWYAAKT